MTVYFLYWQDKANVAEGGRDDRLRKRMLPPRGMATSNRTGVRLHRDAESNWEDQTMQFYLNGYNPGDPDILAAAAGAEARPAALPDTTDVLIVGTGPAGMLLAAQLAVFPGITTRIVDRREGPLQVGQADGVACRTVEMFDAFGLSGKLVREAYWVNETVFWRPSPEDRAKIVRTGRVQDTADGLSEFPHVIVNQARLLGYLEEYMHKSPSRLVPDYGWDFLTLTVEPVGDYPVIVTLRNVKTDEEKTVRAKYVVGCDGARSRVRDAIGAVPRGDFANHAWGVVDMLATTDFPDIRLKAAIQSADEGNILLIPREGGYLVRLYVDLGEIDPANREALRLITQEQVIRTAQRVLRPYTLEVRDVAWFAVYQVGQRVTDRFDDVTADEAGSRMPRVFIAGDACHTHSAKAGQGMNVSMQDAYNLGWKLASVLEGRARADLLRTYTVERHAIAQGLIDFDKEWSKIMASPPKDADHPEREGVDPAELQAYFVMSGRYTAGVATHYPPATYLTAEATHQALAEGFPIGMRFHSAPVVRLADAKPVQLGHVARADGAWRIYAFADASGDRLRALMDHLAHAARSPVRRFTPSGADIDSVIDVRGIFQQGHRDLKVEALAPMLLPRKGRFGLVDYEKAYTPDLRNGSDIFDLRGIDRATGAMIVVRPDQHVGNLLPLDAYGALGDFFGQFMLDQR